MEQAVAEPVATLDPASPETPVNAEALTGEGNAPVTPSPEVKPEAKADEEIIIELGGKEYNGKLSELKEALEARQKYIEKERSLDKGYTQKFQELAKQKQSLESAFGGQIEPQMMQSLGKVYQRSNQDPVLAEILNAVLEGRDYKTLLSGQPKTPEQEYVSGLEQKIRAMEEKMEGFTSSIESRNQAQLFNQAKGEFAKFADVMKSKGVEITDEIDAEMAHFIPAIQRKNPDWDHQQVLEAAYRHATIGDLNRSAIKNVLISADEAKKKGTIRIKPKSSAKPDSEKTYSEIIQEAI